ncbi:MAG: signal peptidase I [Candidatus Lokiarchaeota archaeon]|nr:signal peptidase I [Candidatus Lokiarchaeota archaeon]
MEKSYYQNKDTGEKKEKKKSSKKTIIITVVLLILAVSSSFIFYYILQVALRTSTPVVVVISDSMEPTISKGDLLFVQGEEGDDIQNQSIIVFWGGLSDPIVHRVIDKVLIDDTWYFRTKGDANSRDDGLVSESKVLGVVTGCIPYIGWVKIILTESDVLIPLIVMVIILIVISIGWDIIKEKREETDKEREKGDL